jgi:hypothetical protein
MSLTELELWHRHHQEWLREAEQHGCLAGRMRQGRPRRTSGGEKGRRMAGRMPHGYWNAP